MSLHGGRTLTKTRRKPGKFGKENQVEGDLWHARLGGTCITVRTTLQWLLGYLLVFSRKWHQLQMSQNLIKNVKIKLWLFTLIVSKQRMLTGKPHDHMIPKLLLVCFYSFIYSFQSLLITWEIPPILLDRTYYLKVDLIMASVRIAPGRGAYWYITKHLQ